MIFNVFMRKTVHYICGCVQIEDIKYYRTSPSGNDKSNYITDALIEAGININVLSALESNSIGMSFLPQKTLTTDGYKHVYLSALGGCGNIFLRLLSRLWLYLNLLLYCVKNIKRGDFVLFYNTTIFRLFVEKLFWCIRGKIFFEIEEFYGALSNDKKMIEREINFFNTRCEGFIFVNDLIKKELIIGNKPYSVCYGRYKPNGKISKTLCENVLYEDTIIISYAGLIDNNKYRDAFRAAELAQYLPDNILVSIVGYGTDASIDELKLFIADINKRYGKVKVKYEGCFLGEELDNYYSKVNYGLCLRDTKDEYDKYTFPSKVLVYISHGIIPICTEIRPLLYSSISDNILYIEDSNFREAALQISRNVGKVALADIVFLHNDFVSSLKKLFR